MFRRTVEKIGVIIEPEVRRDICNKFVIQDLKRVFYHYDANQNGSIDYKEFAAAFCGKEPPSSRPQPPPQKVAPQDDPRELLRLFRDKVKARGARGITGLQRIFKIMDDDGSKTLSEPEFIKAVKDFRVGITEESIPTLFNAFDTNHDGTINYDEFLYAIRGELNDFRRGLVEKAFRKMDKDNSGYLDINDIKGIYKTDKHPEVIAGRKTED